MTFPCIPCPARYDAKRDWKSDSRLDPRCALFLLSQDHQLIGAFHQAQELSADAAKALWSAHVWMPAKAHQPWPTTPPGRSLQPAEEWVA